MCHVSITSAAASSGVPESVNDSDSNKDSILQSNTLGCDLQQVEVSPVIASATIVGKEVGAEGKGCTTKFDTTAAVSSSAFTADHDIFNLLGVMVLPESARIIKGLFFKVNVFAERIYKCMVSKQLPLDMSDKLPSVGQAIWYETYKVMYEASFVSRCLGEYHAKYRPNFVRALPSIKVLSNSSGRDVVALTGDRLLGFLSKLDCVIRSNVESIFNFDWSKVSTTLEEMVLSSVSCKDFIDVLDITGIPAVASSSAVVALRTHTSSKGADRCTSSGSNPQLTLLSNTGLTLRTRYQSKSQLVSSLPSGEAFGTPYELTLLPSVGGSGGGFSPDSIAPKRDTSSSRVYVSTHTETGVIHDTVGISSVSTEVNVLSSSVMSASSSCVSSSVQCVDLLGVKLHPDSAELIYKLFFDLRKSVKRSFSGSILNYLLTVVSSELSTVGRAIWCKTYKELHLSRFMSKSLCVYHFKYRPDFIRALADIRILSSSPDRMLVPLSGGILLDFLSKLDCAVCEIVESIFNSEWDRVADRVFSELEDGSLGTVSCEDFISVINTVGVPLVAFSISQRRAISKSKTSGSSSKCAVEATESRSSIIDFTRSLITSLPQLKFQLELSPQLHHRSELADVAGPPYKFIRSPFVGESDTATAPFFPVESAVSSSACTIDTDVFDVLGVRLLPESARIIDNLFLETNALARRIYKGMVSKQLPPYISDKLSVTGRAIWYGTYRMLCEANFVSRCLGEYHAKYRPDFIRALPSIQVLSNSSGSDVVTLTGDRLLSFLSKLDSAVHDTVERIFNSDWSEIVDKTFTSLKEGSLYAVNCKDFIDVLRIADIPAVALSVTVGPTTRTKSKVMGKCTSSVISDTLTVEGHTSSSSVFISTHAETGSISAAVGIPPISSEANTTLFSIPSSCVSSSVQCVDLLGVKLHPGSAELVYKLFSDLRKSVKKSFSSSILNYLLAAVSSEISTVGRAIWCKNYRELHLYSFISKCLCVYHSKYRPNFISVLSDIRVLSSSADSRLVPLSGGDLLGFLSRLDRAICEIVESIFNSEWDRVADRVFSELEDGSLSTVGCEDFISVLDTVGIPLVAFSISQRRTLKRQRRAIGKNKTSESNSKCAFEGMGPGSSVIGSTRSLGTSLSQFQSQPELYPQPRFESSLPIITESVAVSTVSGESSSTIREDVLVSTVDVVASALRVLEDALPLPLSSFSTASLPVSLSSPLSLPLSELGVDTDIFSSSPVRLTAVADVPAFKGAGDESPSPPSSPSISPASSSSYLSSSPSESGLDADVSSSSPESPVLTREVVGLATEDTVSELMALGESHSAHSCEQLIVPTTASSFVSTAAIGESSAAASNSSFSYFRGPKKLFIMRELDKGTFEVPTSGGAAAGPSSALVDVGSSLMAATGTAAKEEDMGVRLTVSLNRWLPPSSANELSGAMRGGRGRSFSSHHDGAQRGKGRKRKRES
ncbi:hypothetical protein [Candidatus Ichthyocystis hellenicum]|uniref:hypothetical protein n=1 Tax=Candidatus Ichthyocystis hellenicum TaxID=1561003 RepID=UPI000B86D1F8|nr:hypothetical protein [Candidatus Ichthyocystis hellenicum]